MDKMSKWIVKYRNMILAVAIVLLIPSAIGYFNTNINYDLLSYLPSTSESMKTQKILGDDFNLSSVDFLVVNNKTDQEAAKIKEEINKIDGVEKCIWRDDVLDISVPKQAIPESIQDMLYSGDSTMMIVTFKEPTSSMRTMNAISKIKKYTKDLFLAVKEHKTLMNLDGFLYIAGTTPMLVITMVLMLINCVMYASQTMNSAEFVVNLLNYVIPTLLLPIGTALLAMILDKKPIKPMIKGLLCYPAFMGTWIIINIKCLFKRETTWEKIDHVRNIKIAEVTATDAEEAPEKI